MNIMQVKESYNEISGVKSVEEIAKKLAYSAEIHNGIKTGFEQLDTITKGLHNGNLILLCGRPSVGKNIFMLDVARKVSSTNKKVMIFSLCLSSEQLVKRIIPSLDNTLSEPFVSNLFFYDSATISFEELTSKCIKMKQDNLLDVLIVDRLQNLSLNGNRVVGGRYSSRDNDWDYISIGLRMLAKNLNIPIIVLADVEGADDDIWFSRYHDAINIITNDADVVLFMSPDKTDDNNSFVDLKVTKNRNGKRGTLRYKLDDSKQCFYEEQYISA